MRLKLFLLATGQGRKADVVKTKDDERIVEAVLYALRCGCFFPVLEPTPPYRLDDLTKWGAMRNLHTAIAEATRP